MLTGPITILQWSFVRDDQPRQTTAEQIAFAIRDEVADLEKNVIRMIQIDEPALREGLPLKRSDWDSYLKWSVNAFKISSAVAKDETHGQARLLGLYQGSLSRRPRVLYPNGNRPLFRGE